MNLINFFNYIHRYWFTIKHLRFRQIIFRIYYKVYKPQIRLINIPHYSTEKSLIVKPMIKNKCYFGDGNFKFLSKLQNLNETGWNNDNIPKLWMYNLNYFDFLLQESSEQEAAELYNLLFEWVEGNEIYKDVGWEPYPTSLRIVNWAKWFLLGNPFPVKLQASLVKQVRFLNKRIEWHIDGNHVVANAKALIFAGALFDGQESKTWISKGSKIFMDELDKQILGDGAHFELSPMYHCIILEDLLDVINLYLSIKYCEKDINRLICKAQSMLRWLSDVVHPDRKIPHFNDASSDAAKSYDVIGEYASALAVTQAKVTCGYNDLEDSGYITSNLGSSYLIVDAGEIGPPYQPGHGHADTLSFELSIFGKRVFVNAGVSTYEIGFIRSKERSSSSHNTVEVNGCNSSDVWASFRVGRRAKIISKNLTRTSESTQIEVSHSGYKHMKASPIHSRSYLHTCEHLHITDTISGDFHEAVGRLHIHPEIEIYEDFLVKHLLLKVCHGKWVKLEFFDCHYEIQDFEYASDFGLTTKSKCVEYFITKSVANIRITWFKK